MSRTAISPFTASKASKIASLTDPGLRRVLTMGKSRRPDVTAPRLPPSGRVESQPGPHNGLYPSKASHPRRRDFLGSGAGRVRSRSGCRSICTPVTSCPPPSMMPAASVPARTGLIRRPARASVAVRFAAKACTRIRTCLRLRHLVYDEGLNHADPFPAPVEADSVDELASVLLPTEGTRPSAVVFALT